jgi:chitodextrinase
MSATATSVTIAWPLSADRAAVGYGIYVNGARVATVTPNAKRVRNGGSLSHMIQKLACGTGYTVGVDAYDKKDNHSPATSTTVSTSACPDTTPPSVPTGIRQVATTENSVMLAWSPSTDNVGVVAYGLYVAGLRVSSAGDASTTLTNLKCGTNYLIGIDAADGAGNRSARVDSYFRTSACPASNQPPSTPTGLTVSAATPTSVTLRWSASTDDSAVAGYGLYVTGKRTAETTSTSAAFSGLECGTTYTLGVDAFDAAGKRSTVTELSTATSPCALPPSNAGATVTQTITDGATLSGAVNWRAVYHRQGDSTPDDPGSVRFRVDGKVVLTDTSMPFGDTSGFWSSSAVANGRHTFEVEAVTDTGTVAAADTVSASVANNAAPSGTDSTPPSAPTSLRVVSVTTTSVTIGWSASNDDVGVGGYGLYRGSSQTGQTQQTTATYDGLTCGTAYEVGVDAYDAAGNRSSRANLSATTSPCPDTQPPTAPTNVTVATRTATSISLTWAPATDNVGVAAYSLYNNGELVGATAGTTGIVSGLQCNTPYTLAVDAFDAAGNSSAKTTVMVSTLPCPDTTPPSQPTNVRVASTTTTSITLAWNASTDNVGVAGYRLYNGSQLVNTTTGTGTTGVVSGLTCGTNYTLAVDAFDAAGNSSSKTTILASSQSCADTTPPTVTITAPTNGSTMKGTMNTAATATDNVGVTRVEFFRDGTSIGSDTSSPYALAVDTTTIGNGSHTLSARAYDSAGNVGNASAVAVTVSNTAPAAPTTDFPDASDTGVPAGTALTAYTGPSSITTPNTVIDGKRMGCVSINTTGVVIRNSVISCDGSDYYSVDVGASGSVTVEDSNIDCQSHNSNGAGRMNITLRRVDISLCENGLSVAHDVTVEDSYIHDLYMGGGAHADGMQFENAANNVTIRHNTIYGVGSNGQLGTSALIMDLPGHSNFLIDNNLFGGGAYTVYCVNPGKGTNWRITNNHFTTRFSSKGGAFGFSVYCSDETQSGNVNDETGAPLSLG